MFIKVVTLYVGAIIGAGFASGQEILQFFINYRHEGLLGVLITTILFSYCGGAIMYLATKYKSGSYQELLPHLMGPVAKIMDVISLVMLVGGLGIMMAGSGAVLHQYMALPINVGILLALTITIGVICGGVGRVLNANLILVPIKLLAVVIIAIIAILNPTVNTVDTAMEVNQTLVASHWLWASILYASYNMIVPLAVLSSVGKIIEPKIGIVGGLAGGLMLGLVTGLVTLAGLLFYPEIKNYPVPMLYMASVAAPILKTFFALLIWLAMITTAIADAHGFASRVAPQGGKLYKISGIAICIMVLPLTKLDFAQLVQKIYPMFGYGGLILMVSLVIMPLMNRR
ncbi:hypothetical protein V6C27_12570 [Peptococcaceae bacterium 1198_IL3148]